MIGFRAVCTRVTACDATQYLIYLIYPAIGRQDGAILRHGPPGPRTRAAEGLLAGPSCGRPQAGRCLHAQFITVVFTLELNVRT